MMTVTEELDNAIAKVNGDVRHALNLMMADRDIARALLEKQKEKSIALVETLETIRAFIWPPGPTSPELRTIDNIACAALKIAGQTP